MKFTFKNQAKPILLLVLLIFSGNEPGATGEPASTPNIVVMLADDQTWFDSGVYGNPDLRTPNIDRLAAEGLRFTSAFTGTAMCAPTRQMLYTGLYPIRSGAYPNGSWVNEGTKSIVHYMQALGYRTGITGKRHVGPDSSFPWEILGSAAFMSDIDMDAVVEFVKRDDTQPFFLIVASHNPHFPWPEVDQSRYDPDELMVPVHMIDTPETREALAVYYTEVTAFDDQLGEVLSLLDEDGRDENTLLIYSSEQGNMFPFAKWTLYDAGIKTAMIARWPGHIEPGATTDAMVHYVDVTPTLVEAAGGHAPAGVEGSSFLDVLLGRTDAHREFVFGAHTTRGIANWMFDYPVRSVRSREYKLILNLNAGKPFSNNITAENRGGYYESWKMKGESGDERALAMYEKYYQRPAVELYNVVDDPFEQQNLAGQEAFASIQRNLTARLEEWMASQGDRGLETEMEAEAHLAGR